MTNNGSPKDQVVALATVGALIEVTPWDELQHWPDKDTVWSFIDDHRPFRFRVAGELLDGGLFFGLQGPVESGPERYLNLICNILLRHDNSDWRNTSECGSTFIVCPSIAKRDPAYNPATHDDLPFYLHPKGTIVEGYPRISRFGGVRVLEQPTHENQRIRALG